MTRSELTVTGESSGIPDLDRLLGGLLPGDNIVWVSSEDNLLEQLEVAFIDAGLQRDAPCWHVVIRDGVRARKGAKVLDARPGRRLADPFRLEEAVVQRAREGRGRVVVDSLDAAARRWGRKQALGFFSRVCPQLLNLGSIAYWRGSRAALGSPFLDAVEKVTQCVFEIGGGHLRLVKAEGRAGVQGRLLKVRAGDDGGLRLEDERALGRLGEGLRLVRQERHLSQGDLARLAGVSPSAISQAEAGHRGLALDTLLKLSEALGVGLDHLLAIRTRPEYVLARRERGGAARSHVSLLEDPSAGLRAHLVRLRGGEEGKPPIVHKGVELVLVAAGLVQVDVGSATPVLRPGDALLATRTAVAGWRNLLAEPAQLFWVLRD